MTNTMFAYGRVPRHFATVGLLALAILSCGPRGESTEDAAGPETEAEHEEQPGVVTLTEEAVRTAGIEVITIALESSSTPVGLEVPGQVEFDPRRVTLITPRASGRVESLTVVSGDKVTGGQVVALLYSPEFLTAQQEFGQATRRARRLVGTPDAEGTAALAHAARQRLLAMGTTEPTLQALENGTATQSLLPVRAPFGGSIMDSDVLTGVMVKPGDSLFRLADLSVVDVIAQVPERALPRVRVGQGATIEIVAFPGMQFEGQVERLHEELNPETRTVEAVIHAANPGGRLRPGMFATVRLRTSTRDVVGSRGVSDSMITVPSSAVVTDGEARIVFVEVGPRTYERREVEVASLTPQGSSVSSSGRVAVRQGLTPGDRVVTHGAFTLKSELAKAGLGEHGH
jgi:RND family efflux transporter MFP subunit